MRTVSHIVSSYTQLEMLTETLASVAVQTIPFHQIIVVDDASTDGSAEYLRSWAASDPSHKVFVFEKNQGRSGSRNKGMELSEGAYIAFLDGDDWLEPGAHQEMQRMISDNDPDVGIFNLRMVDHVTGKKHTLSERHPYFSTKGLNVARPSTDEERALLLRMIPTHWSKIHKSSFLKEHGFQFAARIYEDIFWHYQCLFLADRLCCSAMPLVNYRIHPDSILSTTSEEHFGVFDAFERTQAFAEQQKKPSRIMIEMARRHRFNTLCFIAQFTTRVPDHLLQKFAQRALGTKGLTAFEMTDNEQGLLVDLHKLADGLPRPSQG